MTHPFHACVFVCAAAAVVVVSPIVACAGDAPKKSSEAPRAIEHEEMAAPPVAPTEPIADDAAPSPPSPPSGPSSTPQRSLPTQSGPKVDPIQVTIFNRVMVKPKDASLPVGEITRLVEEAVGAKVESARRTAVGYWLVQLAPTTPPRTTDDQRRVIEQLQAIGAFAIVEGDQLMQIR